MRRTIDPRPAPVPARLVRLTIEMPQPSQRCLEEALGEAFICRDGGGVGCHVDYHYQLTTDQPLCDESHVLSGACIPAGPVEDLW